MTSKSEDSKREQSQIRVSEFLDGDARDRIKRASGRGERQDAFCPGRTAAGAITIAVRFASRVRESLLSGNARVPWPRSGSIDVLAKPFQPLPRRCATLTRSLPGINDKSNERSAPYARRFLIYSGRWARADRSTDRSKNSIRFDISVCECLFPIWRSATAIVYHSRLNSHRDRHRRAFIVSSYFNFGDRSDRMNTALITVFAVRLFFERGEAPVRFMLMSSSVSAVYACSQQMTLAVRLPTLCYAGTCDCSIPLCRCFP